MMTKKQQDEMMEEMVALQRKNRDLKDRLERSENRTLQVKEEYEKISNNLRVSYGNVLYRMANDHAAIEFALRGIIERSDQITIITHMAERANGDACNLHYKQIAALKMEIEFLTRAFHVITRSGYQNFEAQMNREKNRYDDRIKTILEEKKEYSDFDGRQMLELELFSSLGFHCHGAGSRASAKFKEDLLATDGSEFVKEYADKYSW